VFAIVDVRGPTPTLGSHSTRFFRTVAGCSSRATPSAPVTANL
jgi:hypothetical protein